MPEFDQLRRELLRSGIAPRHVRRTIDELKDHHEDLVDQGLADGASRVDAIASASDRLGQVSDIALAARAQPELRSWAFRFPRVAALVYPITFLALLPAAPVFLGYAHASYIVRWAACLFLSAVVTAGLFLFLQLAITLS